ncbi:ORF18 [Psittacine aviadenovirus B]|uniref:ORF18 n=1 Tax=psittacine adenovirus 4 TaxID=2773287 RepID=A0A1P8SW86_9ADEN|nr:ORF18 [Psittacine aviadenovirus B]APY28369.1 ORF18 [psittacine adenovirus 4]
MLKANPSSLGSSLRRRCSEKKDLSSALLLLLRTDHMLRTLLIAVLVSFAIFPLFASPSPSFALSFLLPC